MKKFAALFATVLVMALSATSVFAAGSASLNENVGTNVTGVTTSETSVTLSTQAFGTGIYMPQASDVKADTLSEAPSNAASVEIVAWTDITYTGTIPASGVEITLNVTGISAGDKVYIMHYTSDTAYEKLAATAGDGTVTATFTSLSPVVVVKYTEATTPAPAPQPQAPSYNYDDEPVSPKTGVLPVAAIAAGICLAGVAVCGKKVKFN